MKIGAGLERTFAAQGFAAPSVEDLRDGAGVSLRTLYKYMPSRADMVVAALESRHARYLARILEDLPEDPETVLDVLFERVGLWMREEASHGCMFHAAVAAAPDDARLRDMLARHKAEVAQRAARATGLEGRDACLMVLLEGLTQSWPLLGDAAVAAAKEMGASLREETRAA